MDAQLEQMDVTITLEIRKRQKLTDIIVTIRENIEITFDFKANEACTAAKWKCTSFQIGDDRITPYSLPQVYIVGDTGGEQIIYGDATHTSKGFNAVDNTIVNTMTDGNWHRIYVKGTNTERIFIVDDDPSMKLSWPGTYDISQYYGQKFPIWVSGVSSDHQNRNSMRPLKICASIHIIISMMTRITWWSNTRSHNKSHN